MDDITLKEHLEKIISANDERIERVVQANDRRYEERFAAQEKAIEKANASIDERLANTNEWRQVINDMVKKDQGKDSGIAAGWALAIGAAGFVALIFSFFRR